MFAISKPAVLINNEPFPVKPNSVQIDEGEGETTVRTQSIGGNEVDLVITDNAEDKKGMFSMEALNTAENIEKVRQYKKNPGKNAVNISGTDEDGNVFNRTFTKASIQSRVKWDLTTDGGCSLEWESKQPI